MNRTAEVSQPKALFDVYKKTETATPFEILFERDYQEANLEDIRKAFHERIHAYDPVHHPSESSIAQAICEKIKEAYAQVTDLQYRIERGDRYYTLATDVNDEKRMQFAKQAEREYSIVTELDRKHALAWLMKGKAIVLQKEKDRDDAVMACFKCARTQDPNLLEAYTLAVPHLLSSNSIEAKQLLTHGLAIKPSATLYCDRAEIFLKENELGRAYQDYTEALMLEPGNLRAEKGFESTNKVTFIIDGKTIDCKRDCLSGNSYFKKLFQGHFSESRKVEIEINGISEKAFRAVIDFILTQSCTITEDIVAELWRASDMYFVDGLFSACENFLTHELPGVGKLTPIGYVKFLEAATVIPSKSTHLKSILDGYFDHILRIEIRRRSYGSGGPWTPLAAALGEIMTYAMRNGFERALRSLIPRLKESDIDLNCFPGDSGKLLYGLLENNFDDLFLDVLNIPKVRFFYDQSKVLKLAIKLQKREIIECLLKKYTELSDGLTELALVVMNDHTSDGTIGQIESAALKGNNEMMNVLFTLLDKVSNRISSPTYINLWEILYTIIKNKPCKEVVESFWKHSKSLPLQEDVEFKALQKCLPQSTENGDKGIIKLLIQYGAVPSEITFENEKENANICYTSTELRGETLYHRVARKGLVDAVEVFCREKCLGLEDFNSDGLCPLHLALKYQHEKVFDLLYHQNPLVQDKGRRNILHFLASDVTEFAFFPMINRSESMAQLIFQQDNKGYLPIHQAIESDHYALFDELVGLGVLNNFSYENKIYRTGTGKTPFDFLCDQGEKKGLMTTISRLLDSNKNKNARDLVGQLFLWAASREYFEVVNFLVKQYKVDVNVLDGRGECALHWAAQKGSLSAVTFLIDSGANISICNNQKRSPLHVASEYGHYLIVDYLLKKRADSNLWDEHGQTPRHLAMRRLNQYKKDGFFSVENDRNVTSTIIQRYEIVINILEKGSCNVQ
ncbi:MAG: hypothetical protein K940chlam7_01401 [Chlamydiae bacterium]|nr:hypothetical protein [Chlamydiota bacterium]